MREIKFRGKAQDGSWFYGDFSRHFNGDEHIAVITDQPDGENVVVDPDTVGQYTGLKDCNGREIYEGDIVKTYSGNISVVIWDDATHGWREMSNGIKYRFAPGEKARAYTIIGNIHDNPDLLGAAHDQSD